MESNDENLWEQVMEEAGGTARRPGLWAKCFAQANGDESQAKAAYMKARVAEIHAERERERQQATANAIHQEGLRLASSNGKCPSCGKLIPLQSLECKYCRALFGADSSWSVQPLSAEEREKLAAEGADLTDPDHKQTVVDTTLAHETGDHHNGEFSFGYEGRIGRRTYLVTSLVVSIVAGLLYAVAMSADAPAMAAIVLAAMAIVQSMPNAQRLHDLNYSGWVQLVGMIPLVNLFIGAMLFFRKGTAGPNQYGPDPLGN
jgi:uncharacterized membrane protein YhaH (DUF805 family)/RNA polymerase-binding transcription factor DksA